MRERRKGYLTRGSLKVGIRSQEPVEQTMGNLRNPLSPPEFEELKEIRFVYIEGEMHEPLGEDSIRSLFKR